MEVTKFSSIFAILEGGPGNIPEASRLREVDPSEEKIKLPHYGGYEHFQRVGGLEGTGSNGNASALVFLWTMRTEVAE